MFFRINSSEACHTTSSSSEQRGIGVVNKEYIRYLHAITGAAYTTPFYLRNPYDAGCGG